MGWGCCASLPRAPLQRCGDRPTPARAKPLLHLTRDPAVSLLVCFQGDRGAAGTDPREGETGRQACREAGGQTGIPSQNCRDVAFCSQGKYLH